MWRPHALGKLVCETGPYGYHASCIGPKVVVTRLPDDHGKSFNKPRATVFPDQPTNADGPKGRVVRSAGRKRLNQSDLGMNPLAANPAPSRKRKTAPIIQDSDDGNSDVVITAERPYSKGETRTSPRLRKTLGLFVLIKSTHLYPDSVASYLLEFASNVFCQEQTSLTQRIRKVEKLMMIEMTPSMIHSLRRAWLGISDTKTSVLLQVGEIQLHYPTLLLERE